MSQKYYTGGEKLEHLRKHINSICSNKNYKRSLFMDNQIFCEFSEMAAFPIVYLNNVLLRTAIGNTSHEENVKNVSIAANNAIEFLNKYAEDLNNNFYEEKLRVYDCLYSDYLNTSLIKAYPIYAEILKSVSNEYRAFRKKLFESFDFTEYMELISLYNDLQDGLSKPQMSHCFASESIAYISHTAEILMDRLLMMFFNEFSTEHLTDDESNKMRKLIYALKNELGLEEE